MTNDTFPLGTPEAENRDRGMDGGVSRREFLKGGAAGLAAGGLVGTGLGAGVAMGLQTQAGPPRVRAAFC